MAVNHMPQSIFVRYSGRLQIDTEHLGSSGATQVFEHPLLRGMINHERGEFFGDIIAER